MVVFIATKTAPITKYYVAKDNGDSHKEAANTHTGQSDLSVRLFDFQQIPFFDFQWKLL